MLYTNTNKVVESENVNLDEYTEVHEAEPIKEPEEYKSFVHFYEGMEIEEDVAHQQQVLVNTESHTMNAKLHLGIEPHSNAKLQNEVEAHSNSKISVHETNVELPNKDVHSDSKVERPNEETRAKPRLFNYVERHHPTTQIIGDKDVRPMKRKKIEKSYMYTEHERT